jgi:hypothetical protein
MNNTTRLASTLALAITCSAAGAGMHQICFEGMPEYKNNVWVPNAIYGCAVDEPGYSCRVDGPNGGISRNGYPLNQTVQVPGATFKYYDFGISAGTFSGTMTFFDANMQQIAVRACTVTAQGGYASTHGYATYGSVLTGFTTDASGLVTTGVWKLQGSSNHWARITAQTPSDFVVVGGGAMGVETPIGALIIESTRSNYDPKRSWIGGTSEAGGAAQLHATTAFVIGMHVEGFSTGTLASMIQSTTTSSSPVAALVSAQVSQPATGGVVLSGGINAHADPTNSSTLIGQFATVTAPVIGNVLNCSTYPCQPATAVTGWRVESKDHVISHPGTVDLDLLSLAGPITINGVTYNIVAKYVSAASGFAAHPTIDVSGLRGEYALTGIGAFVNWNFPGLSMPGNLLWRLEPRADLGGASVASKDHILSSPATITGYAIGIKLVVPQVVKPPICCVI